MCLHTTTDSVLYRHHHQRCVASWNGCYGHVLDTNLKDILDRPVNEVISLVESKEMARDALPVSSAGILSLIHRT